LKKHILIISNSGNLLGGANASLIAWLKYLPSHRYRFTVVMPTYEGFEKELDNLGVHTIKSYLLPWVYKYGGLSNLFKDVLVQFRDHLKLLFFCINQNVALVYTNTTFNISGALLSKIIRIPHIWHLREVVMSPPYEYGLNTFVVSKYISILSAKTITNSKYVLDNSILKKFRKKSVIIYNGVDLKMFNGCNQSSTKRSFIVGVIGNIRWLKAQHLTLEIAQYTKHEKNIHYHIIGGKSNQSSKGYFNNIKKKIIENGLEGTVFLKGYIQQPLAINNIDILLNLCPYEAFGRVIIESMAAGRPVVSVNSGAATEIICDNNNGILINRNEHWMFAKVIEQLKSDKKLYYKLANNARSTVRDRFDIDKYCRNILSEIQALV
jgi:glycosyltransferase involved in cell wall biosynthesis